jgi:hypothetical protein
MDYFIGVSDTTTAPTVNDTLPANGVFLWTNNTTAASGGSLTLQGMVRASSATIGTSVSCTGAYTYGNSITARIQVESATTARFLIDFNAGDGVNFTDCGVVTGTFPTAQLAPQFIAIHTETTARQFDIDYFRVWQDDSPADPVVAPESAPVDTVAPPAGADQAAASTPPLTVDSATAGPDPKATLADLMSRTDPDSIASAGRVDTGYLTALGGIVTPELTADRVVANTIKPIGVDITMELGVDGRFVIKNPAGQEAITFDGAGNAIFGGTVTADKIKANQIEGLQSVLDTGQPPDPTSPVPEASIDLGSVSIKNAKISFDLTVGGALVASGGLTIDGPAQFNGQVAFKDQAIFNSITKFLGAVSFDQNVLFGAHVIFGQDAGGTAIIKQGDSKVTIKYALPYDQAPVVVANYNFEETQNPDGTVDTMEAKQQRLLDGSYNYGVGKVTSSGFVIFLNKPASEDIRLQWLATPVKDAKISLSEGQ